MKRCTGNACNQPEIEMIQETKAKPLVSILMAVYKPNEKWLREQLLSLNTQTYENLELVIYDDCPDFPVDEGIIAECIRSIPYRLLRGEHNLGSNKAFERLTLEGRGDWFSYCDQDDVWHADKVERMMKKVEEECAVLVGSDLAIIDGEGVRYADSITKIRRRHVFLEGEGLAPTLLIRNFIPGCAMLIRADLARKSVPFVNSLVHDQWLAINAAIEGRISVIREPLIEYRQHKNNQTAMLKGVETRQDYFNERIGNMSDRLADYRKRLSSCKQLEQTLADLEAFNQARIRYFSHPSLRDWKVMRKYRHFSKEAVMLESVMPFLPKSLLKWIFERIRSGKI